MIRQNPCTPYRESSEDPASFQQESWENYFNSEQENAFSLHSPGVGISEMVFEKIEESSEKMEEDFIPYDEELYYRDFVEDLEYPQEEELRKADAFRFNLEHDDALYEEDSECSRRCNSEDEEEEAASISTRGSVYTSGLTNLEGDSQCNITDDNLFADTSLDLENELTRKAQNFINGLPDDQKSYIHKIFPMLISSLQEIYRTHRLPLNDDIIRSILKELLYGRVQMIGAEKTVFQGMVQAEMSEMRSQRPEGMVTEDDLAASNRKEKKAPKGNRNTSNLNHLHENYVSNIFQFAKRNYPEDKEVQKLGNERNVSASNFKKLMNTKLTDDIMTRKAKARITGSGSELVENIEYWMKDGYFDQCADREKYIHHKEKALRDLALSGKY